MHALTHLEGATCDTGIQAISDGIRGHTRKVMLGQWCESAIRPQSQERRVRLLEVEGNREFVRRNVR